VEGEDGEVAAETFFEGKWQGVRLRVAGVDHLLHRGEVLTECAAHVGVTDSRGGKVEGQIAFAEGLQNCAFVVDLGGAEEIVAAELVFDSDVPSLRVADAIIATAS